MHIGSVSYILNENFEIISIADNFLEFRHVNGTPFQPGEVWGSGLWSHIHQNKLGNTYRALFTKGRRRHLSIPFRLDTERTLELWQLDAEPSGSDLLVSFRPLATGVRSRLAGGEVFVKPPLPLTYCGWCNRVTRPGQSPVWSSVEEAGYFMVLRAVSPSSVRVALCDECTSALIRSHEPKGFDHLALGLAAKTCEHQSTLHHNRQIMQKAPAF